MKVNDHIELFITRLEESVLDVLENHFDRLVVVRNVLESVFVGV